MKTDVMVIGGGPAGIAAAVAARRKGLDVIVADACVPPIDKACGEGLMPDSMAAASAIGLSIPMEGSFPFRGIRFLGGHHAVDASFPNGMARGVRRTVLHESLVTQAENAGVRFAWRSTVVGIDDTSVHFTDGAARARWIIGADGTASRVRNWAGLERSSRHTQRFGFRRHYRTAPWTDCMELYWGERCQIYVTPVAVDEVCVALISRESHLRLDTALQQFPNLVERLARAEFATTERGAVTASRRLRRVTNRNVALIGDASGSVDAITGEGLCLAFKQAAALADAFATEDLACYESAHRSILRRPQFMAEFMLLLDRFPGLQERVLKSLSQKPQMFASMLAMHVGAENPVAFAGTTAELGWRIVTG